MADINVNMHFHFDEDNSLSDEVKKEIKYHPDRNNIRKDIYHNVTAYSFTVENERVLSIHVTQPEKSVEELVEERLDYQMLREAISSLSKIQARRISLYYFEGFSISEIAVKEGVSVVAVSKTIKTAKKNLKKTMKNF